MTGLTPAVVWADRAEWARCRQAQATTAADYIADRPKRPDDLWLAELHTTLARIERDRAAAYAEYAFLCETAFQNAALHEMTGDVA